MSDLVVAALKIGFLLLLWLFILFAANVIRTDMFGRSVAPAAEIEPLTDVPASPKVRKPRHGDPTKLVLSEGSGAGTEVPLMGLISLGRGPEETLRLDDDFASTRHARLRQDESGTWLIEDLQSTNGTFLNGERVGAPTPVRRGDDIRIGRTHLRLES